MKQTNKSIKYFPFITFMLFVLFSGVVLAVIDVQTYTTSRDFTATTQYNSVSVCSCSTKYDTITIANTGTWPAIFSLGINQVDDKITFSDNNFELTPGQSRDVFMYITAPCTEGSDNLNIIVTSNLGVQKVLAKTIARNKCENIALWMSNYTMDINPCQEKTLELFVQNVGSFKEDYEVRSNNDDYIHYNTNRFSLEPNQIAKVNAVVKLDCNIYGSRNILFSARSINNRLTSTISVPFNIQRNYDYIVRVDGNSNDTSNNAVCNRLWSTSIPVTITNMGAVANNYTFDFNSVPGIVKITGLTDERISLNPKETKIFYIDVDTHKYRSEYKTEDLKIKVHSELGDIDKEYKVMLNLQPCYEHTVQIIKNAGFKSSDAQNICAQYIYKYDVEVKNNGAFTQNYNLFLEGSPSSVSLSKNSLRLGPGEKGTVQLIAIGPGYDYYYNIKVNAQIGNGITEKDNIWIKSYTKEDCHKIVFDDTSFRINYGTKDVNVDIKNKGIANGVYVIAWDGSKIIDYAGDMVALNKSQSLHITLPVKSNNASEGDYGGSLIVKNVESDTVYRHDINFRLKDKLIFTKGFEYLAFGNTCRQFSLYETFAILLVVLLIILFLIITPKYKYNTGNRLRSKIPVMILLIAIFIIGLIFVIIFAGFPKTTAQAYNLTTDVSELRFEWLQGSKYTLDAGQFFIDPDNNTLSYGITGTTHIKPAINGQMITLYPDYGWSGIEYARIIAYDLQGGSTESPEMTLIVRNIPRKSTMELYSIYCWYVNLAILAIILILIFIAVFVKQKVRKRG